MNYTIVVKDGITHLTIEGQLDAVSVGDLRMELDKLVDTPTACRGGEPDRAAPDRQLGRGCPGLALQAGQIAGRKRHDLTVSAISRWRSSSF